MKWLVQEFLNNGSNSIRIQQALGHCSVDYLIVRLNKDNTLTVVDKDTKLPIDDSQEILKHFLFNEDIMVYGSKAFANLAKEMGLNPGSFMNDTFEFEVFQQVLGNELLNTEFVVGDLWSLTPISDEFFIRPTGNTKLFTGMTITKEDLLVWQQRERIGNSPFTGESLMVSPVKEILTEYRFFVINQKIVTGSSYKVGNSFNMTLHPSKVMMEYTNKIVQAFALAEAFVIDIAETDSGFKVIEYNNINSSGLYGCDEVAIVRAINHLPVNR